MKEGEHIRELIADGRLVDARDAANDFLSTFRDEPFMSSLLLCIKSDLAEWGDEYDQLRERVVNSLLHTFNPDNLSMMIIHTDMYKKCLSYFAEKSLPNGPNGRLSDSP